MNSTVLILCLVALIVSILLQSKFKMPVGLSAMVFALLIFYFGLNKNSGAVINYFPASVVFPMLLAMIYFSLFNSNGTSQLIASKVARLVRGKMKLYPFVLFFVDLIVFTFVSGPIHFVLTPLVYGLALACGGSTIMAITTAYMTFVAGSFNPWIGTPAITKVGYLNTLVGLENAQNVAMVMWFNSIFVLLVLQVIVYVITKSWKVPDIAFEKNAPKTEVTPEQKKSLILLLITVICFVAPSIVKAVGPKAFSAAFSAVLNNYFIFACGILAAVALKLGDWKKMVTRGNLDQVLLITGVTFLIKAASEAGLQEFIMTATQNIPGWLIPPALIIIGAALSFFVATPIVMPVMLPLAASMATTPAQAITYLSCISLGLAVSGISPLSSAGAGFLSVAPDDRREEFSKKQFILAIAAPIVCAVIALIGGASIFSNIFSSWYY